MYLSPTENGEVGEEVVSAIPPPPYPFTATLLGLLLLLLLSHLLTFGVVRILRIIAVRTEPLATALCFALDPPHAPVTFLDHARGVAACLSFLGP